jgi:hypothetical protein
VSSESAILMVCKYRGLETNATFPLAGRPLQRGVWKGVYSRSIGKLSSVGQGTINRDRVDIFSCFPPNSTVECFSFYKETYGGDMLASWIQSD